MNDLSKLQQLASTVSEYRDAPGVDMYVDQIVDLLRDLKPMRYALVPSEIGRGRTIAAYLPENYSVVGRTAGGEYLLAGRDRMGWTLEGYVMPRLASGLFFTHEIGRFDEAI